MNAITESYQSIKTFNPSGILVKIITIMTTIVNKINIINSQGNTLVLHTTLRPKKKISQHFYALWTFTINKNLQIKASMIDPHKEFKQLKPTAKPQELVNRLNRETFFGTYFIQPGQTHLLIFKRILPIQTAGRFLSAQIQETYSELSDQFVKFANELQLISKDTEIKTEKIHSRLVKLRHLKEKIEQERHMRQKAIKYYDLTSCSIKIVSEAIAILGTATRLIEQFKDGQGIIGTVKQDRIKKVFEGVKAEVEKQLKESQELPPSEIVKGIEINEVIKESKIDQGGYSDIFKGQYKASFYPTINPELEYSFTHLNLIQNQKRLLVKKKPKFEQSDDSSFRNEINFLHFIRSSKNPRFSNYYLPRANIPGDPKNKIIFLDYYERNLEKARTRMSLSQLFKACQQIIEGICFLVSKGILHRDLKENNILVDKQGNIKIIDFGSSCGILTSKPLEGSYQAIDDELKSTKQYYLPYKEAISKSNHIAKKYTRDQYNRSETFDVYSFGIILRNLFNLDSQTNDSIIYRQLSYLSKKCRQSNPADRITAPEALLYIYLIHELFKAYNRVEEKTENTALHPTTEER